VLHPQHKIAIADTIKKTVFFILMAFFFTDGAVLSNGSVSFCIARTQICVWFCATRFAHQLKK
jgi:hypothetical protein